MRALALAAVIGLVGALLVGIQQYRVMALQASVTFEQGEKQKAVTANTESQATITTLQAEAKRNAAFQADLNKRLQASKAKARKAEKDFEELKRNSKPVRDWADQPLPGGLFKPADGDKDKRTTN
ncbi:hypothetical protein ACYZT4_11030 [Pseudomonas sp. GB2N2]